MAEIGEGTPDWEGIIAACDKAGARVIYIDIEKGNVSLKQVENMPTPTYVAAGKQIEE